MSYRETALSGVCQALAAEVAGVQAFALPYASERAREISTALSELDIIGRGVRQSALQFMNPIASHEDLHLMVLGHSTCLLVASGLSLSLTFFHLAQWSAPAMSYYIKDDIVLPLLLTIEEVLTQAVQRVAFAIKADHNGEPVLKLQGWSILAALLSIRKVVGIIMVSSATALVTVYTTSEDLYKKFQRFDDDFSQRKHTRVLQEDHEISNKLSQTRQHI